MVFLILTTIILGRGVADVMRRAGHDELDTNRKYMIIHFMVGEGKEREGGEGEVK